MTRLARIVAPGLPHHVTARGNRREPIFFQEGDQALYRRILAEETARAGVEVWAYCLMPNHVHLLLNPSTREGLGRAIGAAHRRWAGFVNARAGWCGHLFGDRFGCVVMDQAHLMAAVRYVAMNPVRAGLCERPQDWPWASTRAHLAGKDDDLATVHPLLELWPDFAGMLAAAPDPRMVDALRAAQWTGRPLGDDGFVRELEHRLGRALAPRAPGRKPPETEHAAFR